MWQYLYPISYACLLGTAAVWFFLKERDVNASWAGKGFLLSALTYVFSFFLEEGLSIFGLLGLLTPDLAIFAAVVLIFNRFAKTNKFIYFVIFAVIAGLKVFLFDTGREKAVQFFSMHEKATCSYKEKCDKSPSKNDLATGAELLIDVKNPSDIAKILQISSEYGLQLRPVFEKFDADDALTTSVDEYFAADIPNDNVCKLNEIIEKLYATGDVDYVEKNEILRLSPIITSEKGSTGTFSVNDPDATKLWGMEKMKLNELHDFLKKYQNAANHRKIKIAILDTGVEGTHEDLRDVYSSVNPDYDYDKLGHGTHCAGIAAAVTNNGLGIASFAPDAGYVEVTSVKVLSDQGWGTQEDIIRGIITAADNGADVISMSLGGPSDDERQKAYEDAVKYANQKGAIVVVAAGNSDENAKFYAPANVNGVITVAALNNSLNKADFSNTVEDLKMGIAAPGTEIYSTFINNEYKYLSGTSMATPYVAGMLAMMKWVKPDLTTEEAYQILHETGQNTVAGKKTGKLIQAQACLKLAEGI